MMNRRISSATMVAGAAAPTRTRPSSGDEAAIIAERHRIAREIHDTLAQGFAAIRLQLELARVESGLPPQTARALDLAYQIAGENLVETRRSMAALKATQPSLEMSLCAAIEGVRRLGQVKMVDALAAVPAAPDEVTHELVRIAQEAMRNAARHAEARTVRVSLEPVRCEGLRLTIADDGKGFDPAQPTGGFGLAGLRERAAGIEAKLSIASTLGLGTEVVVTWISPGARDWTRGPAERAPADCEDLLRVSPNQFRALGNAIWRDPPQNTGQRRAAFSPAGGVVWSRAGQGMAAGAGMGPAGPHDKEQS